MEEIILGWNWISASLMWTSIVGMLWTARRAFRAQRLANDARADAMLAYKQLEAKLAAGRKEPRPVDPEARALLVTRLEPYEVAFVKEFNALVARIAANNNEKGWRDDLPRNDGELIALAHSELSELLEGLRHGNYQSDKIPGFSCAEEEYADVIIRAGDHAEERAWDLGLAIVAKMRFNRTRERKHGGKAF